MTESVAQLSTRLLRTSPDQPYRRLRELLPTVGVDPTLDVLADLFQDDVDQEFGVLVTTNKRVFTFVLHYGRRGDLRKMAASAIISDWCDITEVWHKSPCAEQVIEALQILDSS